MFSKSKIAWSSLLVLVVLIKIFSLFPGAVEKYYSTGLYPVIARLQRLLFGWIPISVGDLFYAATVIWLLVNIFRVCKRIIQKQAGRQYLLSVLRRLTFTLLAVYVVFNLCWGLNYDRAGIAAQLQLKVQPYDNKELARLLQLTVTRLNSLDSLARLHREELAVNRRLLDGAVQSYRNLSARDSRFAYPSPSVKASLYSTLGNYLGFSGYYNPFSGEAQVNVRMPSFTRPYTTCHEIGHSLGYAKENEANFAGYLAAHDSDDPVFLYSVYFDMYYYAARELYLRDSTLVVPLRQSLRPAVRKDFRELLQFYRKFENPFEPVVRHLYGGYLRANRQPQGMKTYNEVVAWLIAYGYKYGWDGV